MVKNVLIEKVNKLIATLFEDEKPVVQLAQYTLEDGTVIEYEALEVGKAVFAVTPEGNSPLADGSYMIDGKDVDVVGGLIESVEEKEKPAEDVVEEVIEVPMEEQIANLKSELELAKENAITTLKAEYEEKIVQLKADYETKIKTEKEKIKVELEKIITLSKESKVVQAPVEDKSEKVFYTKNDLIAMELEEKRKAKK